MIESAVENLDIDESEGEGKIFLDTAGEGLALARGSLRGLYGKLGSAGDTEVDFGSRVLDIE
jgi:hypothetical protein